MTRRTTLYAAFSEGVPCLNVYDYDKRKLAAVVSDRAANGHALPDERIVRCTVAFYRSALERHGLPVPVGLQFT